MNALYRLLALLLVPGFLTPGALAQELGELERPTPRNEQHAALADDGPVRIHVTDRLFESPEAKAALRRYLEARTAQPGTMGKTSSYLIGTEREFNVQYDILNNNTNLWKPVTFTLRASNAVANVWVASELTDDISDADMGALETYIVSETPDGSYDTSRGIVENNNAIFGDPPTFVDPDGVVDILLYDIEEGEEFGCCVLGYVSTQDLDPTPEEGKGNKSNVLHVDLPDGMQQGSVDDVAVTIAHEYQHLIHYAYMSSFSPGEVTFINEGMSEWAEIMNGFQGRRITYLEESLEHYRRLFDWRAGASTAVISKDYQRAGLFTSYLAERLGPEETGRIVRARCPSGATSCAPGTYFTGVEGYDFVLADHGLTFADIAADFHTANFINDQNVAPEYGYSHSQRTSVSASPTTLIDAVTSSSPFEKTVNVGSGGVHYLTWEDVTDLELSIADASGADSKNRDYASLRLVSECSGSDLDVTFLDASAKSFMLPGDCGRATLIVAHTIASNPNFPSSIKPAVRLDITASWEGGAMYAEQSVSHDSGANTDKMFFGIGAQDMMANVFDVPDNARLASVRVAPLYTNEFVDSEGNPLLPDDLPKDFTLRVWADDGTGLPGEELFSQDVEESTETTHIDAQYEVYIFKDVELPDDNTSLSDLPSRIFIGLGNRGSDENIITLSTARNTTSDEVSFWYDADGTTWKPIAERDARLADQAIPIRARFLVPTSTSDETDVELPAQVILDQNYPNPFNPSTSVAYSLPRAMNVRLAVYNLLGQRVATLVDGLRSAGVHETRIDATGWASGVYLYALETESQTLTKRMVVLK